MLADKRIAAVNWQSSAVVEVMTAHFAGTLAQREPTDRRLLTLPPEAGRSA
jgi:hypothetical protein